MVKKTYTELRSHLVEQFQLGMTHSLLVIWGVVAGKFFRKFQFITFIMRNSLKLIY